MHILLCLYRILTAGQKRTIQSTSIFHKSSVDSESLNTYKPEILESVNLSMYQQPLENGKQINKREAFKVNLC